MNTSILHVDASIDSIEAEPTPANDRDPVVTRVVDTAIRREVDAVVHSGNLPASDQNKSGLSKIVAEQLSRLDQSGIPFCHLPKPTEQRHESLNSLQDSEIVQLLSSEPQVIGDVALYGVTGSSDTPLDEVLGSLEETNQYTYNAICIPEKVWPPARKREAAIKAYQVMDAAEIHVNEVLGAGVNQHQTWESDDFDYRVSYPGGWQSGQDSNADQAYAGLLTVKNDSGNYQRISLSGTDVEEEIEEMQNILRIDQASVDEHDTQTVVDLYGLVARAKHQLEARRKELRDTLLNRIDDEETLSGQVASIEQYSRTTRTLKDDPVVRKQLQSSDIGVDDMMSFDKSALRTAVDDDRIEEDAVFQTDQQISIRLNELNME